MKHLGVVSLLACSAVLLSCDDGTAPEPKTPRLTLDTKPSLYVEDGNQNPPPDAPPEYQHNTWMNLRVSAGFIDSYAYGEALLDYSATNAKVSVNIQTRRGDVSVGSNNAVTERSDLLPGLRSISAVTNSQVGGTCGYSVQATGVGNVWDQAFIKANFTQWGHKSGSDTKPASQPPCQKKEEINEGETTVCNGQILFSTGPCGGASGGSPGGGGGDSGGDGGGGVTCELWLITHQESYDGSITWVTIGYSYELRNCR